MSIRPKITVITAVFNAAATIEQTMVSVLSQDYPAFEYVIVDGGSTDGTLSVIQKYADKDTRLHYISEADHGIYDAFNKGVCLSKGEYIEFIGADDALANKHVLGEIAKQLTPDVDMLCGLEYDIVYRSDGKFVQHLMCPELPEAEKRLACNDLVPMIPHEATFIRRTLLEMYPFDRSYRIAGDYKFFLQCLYDQNVKFQKSNTVVLFFSKTGISSAKANTQVQKEYSRIHQELGLPAYQRYLTPWKRRICSVLQCMPLWNWILHSYRILHLKFNLYFLWHEHHCTNQICRWCGRERGNK